MKLGANGLHGGMLSHCNGSGFTNNSGLGLDPGDRKFNSLERGALVEKKRAMKFLIIMIIPVFIIIRLRGGGGFWFGLGSDNSHERSWDWVDCGIDQILASFLVRRMGRGGELLSGRVAQVHISVAATFGLEVWYHSDCRGYHSDCRVAHMMALSWYNWETLYGCFHDLQIGNCPWGLFGWACWLKEDKIRAGITSGAWLNLDGRAECKLDLAWCNVQGDNWLLDWSTYIDPTVMFWGLWGHGVNMMELALNLYFWMWIESLHHHRKGGQSLWLDTKLTSATNGFTGHINKDRDRDITGNF
ncbi:hypothetical protein L1987_50219 [Smallanthus sonchifolius]|uniref:Uncharacterized protein n=1 Tax=Smallanthus sonchifolius TaxID=185202 RepID=A0ACB9FXV6_9ASTR|nr:hypothetical protein L1987_50219 [Smallanthus sonchifolius]